MTVSRAEFEAERAEQLARLQAMPAAMRELRQWLVWKLIKKPGKVKPSKVPFYVSGMARGWPNGKPADGQPTEAQPQVEQGHELDRAALVSFDEAVHALQQSRTWAGVGFAFLPGDGLIGVDLDGAIDLETGEISRQSQLIMMMCPSYTERSVSGTGVHIILQGESEKFKSDDIGVEVYCGGQFFTCTGQHWAGAPTEVLPMGAQELQILRGMVAQAKREAEERKRVEQALKEAERPAKPRPAPQPGRDAHGERGTDFKRVNEAASADLHAWVPSLLPAATRWRDGYRITSKALGRDLQEDLQILPEGIMDFGEEQGKSPIDLVAQWGHKSPYEAMLWLAGLLRIEIERKASRPSSPSANRPEPEPEGEARPDPDGDGAEIPFEDTEAGAFAPEGEQGKPAKAGKAAKASKGDKGGGDKPPKDIDWGKFEELRNNFALIYGTDTVWDGDKRLIMKIANMGHAHGSDMVRLWKGGKSSPRRSDSPGCRWTVMPENVVFDPTEKADPDLNVNLFGGFPTVPVEGDVQPFLDLINFLCSRSSDDPDERWRITDWFICWWAYPLQHKGAKLRTAIVMHGDEGAGKNFLTDTIVEMYGEYGATVGQDELEDKFNDWRSRKLLVVGDEVSSRAELVHNKNRLKALITSTTVQINPKNLPRREEANHINVIFNSNELQPLALDNSDRRYLVLYTPKAREFEFYKKLGKWRDAGGVAALYHYLLHYNLEGFDPYAPAPATKAKADLIDMNRKSPERFWMEWSAGELELPYRTCAMDQAYKAYLKYAQRTGDRFPVQRSMFTRMLLRISETLATADRPACSVEPMNVDYSVLDKRRGIVTTRMLLVMPMPVLDEHMTKLEWATSAFKDFELPLNRYLRRFGDDEDKEGSAPA